MNVVLQLPGEAPIATTLEAFLADNADGLTPHEVAEIRAALARGEAASGPFAQFYRFSLQPALGEVPAPGAA